jgi:site-specific recombinase XerD
MMVSALDRLFEGFMLAKRADGLADTTLQMYEVMFRSLRFPPEKMEDGNLLTPQDLQAWVISLSHYADATRDQRIAKCKSFFNWCHTEGFLDTNPAQGLKRPKKNWQPDPLGEDELHLLLEASKRGRCGDRNYAIICTLLDSGMRNTELRNLGPSDVSLKTG